MRLPSSNSSGCNCSVGSSQTGRTCRRTSGARTSARPRYVTPRCGCTRSFGPRLDSSCPRTPGDVTIKYGATYGDMGSWALPTGKQTTTNSPRPLAAVGPVLSFFPPPSPFRFGSLVPWLVLHPQAPAGFLRSCISLSLTLARIRLLRLNTNGSLTAYYHRRRRPRRSTVPTV